jgi:Raf kinase inhibitor-like YbhB/YbcL family protein
VTASRPLSLWPIVAGLVAVACLTAAAQSDGALARELAPASSGSTLDVRSSAFQPGQPIPRAYSQDGEGLSPALEWAAGPAGTRSFALLMEDPDAKAPKPYVHWSLYNLPPDTTRLHEMIPTLPQLPALKRARQGRNSRGTIGYVGPRPPHGDPPHHYHFQVFALDTMLSLDPGADRQALLAAIKGHVLASGEVIGTFQRP